MAGSLNAASSECNFITPDWNKILLFVIPAIRKTLAVILLLQARLIGDVRPSLWDVTASTSCGGWIRNLFVGACSPAEEPPEERT